LPQQTFQFVPALFPMAHERQLIDPARL